MIAFLKEISDACQRFPERPAIVDRDGARTTDYRSLILFRVFPSVKQA